MAVFFEENDFSFQEKQTFCLSHRILFGAKTERIPSGENSTLEKKSDTLIIQLREETINDSTHHTAKNSNDISGSAAEVR